MNKLVFFLGGTILFLEMHRNQIITSSCAIMKNKRKFVVGDDENNRRI
jgi:hypothetical protein